MSIDEQITALFQEIERELQAHDGQGIALAGVGAEAAIAVTELCQAYRRIRPLLEKVLPGIDPQIVPPFRLLMRIADGACRAPLLNH